MTPKHYQFYYQRHKRKNQEFYIKPENQLQFSFLDNKLIKIYASSHFSGLNYRQRRCSEISAVLLIEL